MHDINTPTFSNFFKLKTYYLGFIRELYTMVEILHEIFLTIFLAARGIDILFFVSFQSDIFVLKNLFLLIMLSV